jgi:hypothetical protein
VGKFVRVANTGLTKRVFAGKSGGRSSQFATASERVQELAVLL